MKRFIVAAFYDEVAPIINALNAIKMCDSPLTYEAEDVTILISGLGKKNTLYVQEKVDISNCKEIINIGLAASTDITLAKGSIFRIRDVYDESGELNIIFDVTSPTSCQTLATPYVDTMEPYLRSSLIDMELFYWAKWCSQNQLTLKAIKLVSDHGKPDLKYIRLKMNEWGATLFNEYLAISS